jgi:uncharacterized protein
MKLARPSGSDPLEVILKVAGETCNINCYYCYEKRKPYGKAEFLGPERLQAFLEVLGDRPLSIGIHGGEPLLLGTKRMAALLEVIRRYPGIVNLSLQTNGTLLTPDWLSLFDEFWPGIEIGISLDGDATTNVFRLDYRDGSTHGRVIDVLENLSVHRRRVGIIAVVTAASIGRAPELIRFFASFACVASLKFVPCFDFQVAVKKLPRGNVGLKQLGSLVEGRPGWAISPDDYAEFVIQAFDVWRASSLFQRFSLEPVMSVLRRLAGKIPDSCHFDDRKCASVVTLYPDGRFGTCDELRLPDSLIGKVENLVSDSPLLSFNTQGDLDGRFAPLLAKCEKCDYRVSCGGGCLATRLSYLGTPLDEAYCRHRQAMIDHVAEAVGQTSRTRLQGPTETAAEEQM